MPRLSTKSMTRRVSAPAAARLLALLLTLTLVLGLVSSVAAAAAPALPAYATPEAAVEAFWNGILCRDVTAAGRTGLPATQLDKAVAIEFRSLLAPDRSGSLTVSQYRTEVNGAEAKVWSLINEWQGGYRFDLVQVGGSWFIDRFTWANPYTIEHARADLDFDTAAGSLSGHITLRVRADMAGLTNVALQVYTPLAVTNVTVDGVPTTINRWSNTPVMFVNTAPATVGGVREIAFDVKGKVHEKDRFTPRIWNDIRTDGAYLAIPLGFTDAKVADLYLSTPNGYQAVSAGELIERTMLAERTVSHYRQTTANYGMAVGNYDASASQRLSGIDVRWNLLPVHAGQGKRVLDLTARILAFYTDRFGAYPWPSLTITEIPTRHGGGVTFPAHILVVPSVTTGVSHAKDWTDLVAHEISHEWWGTSVGGIHPWVWEALASYSSDAFVQADAGEKAFQWLLDARRASYRKAMRIGDAAILSVMSRTENRNYFPIVYDKGALVLHMLRYQLGEDAFWQTLKLFASRYAGKTATPWDLQAVAEEVSGQRLTTFFSQWLGSEARLDLSLEHYRTQLTDQTNSVYTTTFVIENRGSAIADFVDVSIQGIDEQKLVRVDLKGAETPVSIETTWAPRQTVIDPQKWLLDLNEANNRAGVGPLDRGSPMRAMLITFGLAVIGFIVIGITVSYIRRVGWKAAVKRLRFAFAADDRYVRQDTVDFDPNAIQPDVDYSALPASEHVVTERPELWHDGINSILATDVGSTTTKALLWLRTPGASADEFHLAARAESPTTVEAPWEDVTLGLASAIEKLEMLTGRPMLSDGVVVTPPADGVGVDLFISTSSAGGGLQMVVAGVMKRMTADSANRAASAAGGIVTEVLSIDDGRLVIDRVKRLRELRPDIILLSGGIDGGDISHVVNLAEQVAIAEPKTRLGGMKTPLVYAGNAVARSHMTRLLGEVTDLKVVDNIRPVLERENAEPARQMIHQLFMEHVMSQAPGYPRLLEWARNALLPTPGAVGRAIEAFGNKYDINVAAFDIGGATTDVFSRVDGAFHRTVSANLGMSYSATNVLAEATAANVIRWLPFTLSEADVQDWAANKMIRPTSLPQTLRDLIIEQALAREALRLSFVHHQSSLKGLQGIQRRRDMADILEQHGAEAEVRPMSVDALIGSGGVLSHAPRRAQALLMLLDSVQPEGVTELFVDSIFMSPQLGLLSTIRPTLATEILERDGLYLLGTCVAPVGRPVRAGRWLGRVVYRHGNERHEANIVAGRLIRIPLKPDVPYEVIVQPRRGYDVGAGPGKAVETVIEAGLFGLIIDGRGRQPLTIPADPRERIALLRSWYAALDVYDEAALTELCGPAKEAR